MSRDTVGSAVRVRGAFTNLAGALVDPTTVSMICRTPDGTVDPALVYGTHAAAKKAATLLNGAMDDNDTQITVDAATGFAAEDAEFPITDATAKLRLIRIDSETMLVTGGFGTLVWTVERGVGGTTAASHLDNADVIGPYYTDITIESGGDAEHRVRFIGTGAVARAEEVVLGVIQSELVA